MVNSPALQRRLDALSEVGFNFDPAHLSAAAGYRVTDECYALPREAPGDPEPGGSWEIARELITSYAFADPTIVQAYFDPAAPLLGRTMVLRLKTLGVFHVDVGVRIRRVTDETREANGRHFRVWGWTYGTLRGHVEAGEMSWETWKWLDTGEVEFRVHALSQPARISNPFTRVGFSVLGQHERVRFLKSSGQRMRREIEARTRASR